MRTYCCIRQLLVEHQLMLALHVDYVLRAVNQQGRLVGNGLYIMRWDIINYVERFYNVESGGEEPANRQSYITKAPYMR